MSRRVQTRLEAAETRAPSLTPARPGLLRRKCACDNFAGRVGECEECGKRRTSSVLSKPAAGVTGGGPEQEADGAAERAIRQGTHQEGPPVQRRLSDGAGQVAEVPPIVNEVLRSPGRPLDPDARAALEPRFGHDFGRVRVHTDARAAESARAVEALAYTVGSDIVFGAGQYAPHSASGQRLLAHELTHVRQHGNAADTTPPSTLQIGPPGDASEREAHAAEDSLTSPARPPAHQTGGDKAYVRRQPEEEGGGQRETASGQGESDPLPYREAVEATEQGALRDYQRDCAGVNVLQRLERTESSPRQVIQRLERRVRGLPGVFRRREDVKRQIKQSSSMAEEESADPLKGREKKDPFKPMGPEKLREFDKEVIWPEFGRDYALGSLESELRKAQCELSKARWEFLVFVRTGKLPGERRLRRG